ncbi:hypothetical protein PP327_22505 [Mycobacteroides abscessus]|uniref:hypothetical protein n=1 Tax=Mycobacteroides abscessus TaxID=36809 RepID=UPI0007F97384|nr:hypothetical protein [Mycobacteroides abscessus]ANO13103.1 hypothetical protein BAB77_03895 [Mycobacteroides abscessus]MDM2050240.1 hypothetical protein [Mycobacteroides abscessus]MDM2055159.1 hypothetical protein [Mycobacteroides abscessus]MDM2059864.1 hypothetical protein [Mycobacteroides abscessus]MDM2064017.1 hypothetical protein [Mycobacteroides abscessus]
MNDDWRIFELPDRYALTRRADDLLHQVNLVRIHGWDQYRQLWSCGEVLGVALLLGNDSELQRSGETIVSALERWAFDLWGIVGGQEDTDAGLPHTRAWFDSLRVTIGVPAIQQPPVTR